MIVPLDVVADRQAKTLTITFAESGAFTFSAEFLRVHSPSAEVQGHSPEQAVTVGGKAGVGITGLEPVGNYAVRILFDDGHDSGLYSWDTLYTLGRSQAALWAAYLQKLAEAGLTR